VARTGLTCTTFRVNFSIDLEPGVCLAVVSPVASARAANVSVGSVPGVSSDVIIGMMLSLSLGATVSSTILSS
jgi:hypothetical protein